MKNVKLVDAELNQIEQFASFEEDFFCEHCPKGVSLVGKSPAMIKTLNTIRKIALSNCNPVLVVGQSGTGKELAARAVHHWRTGSGENFVAVNCAALTANLLESELFGHVKGAFTGADRDKTGLFEAAGNGTIFLDEISEMPLELQAKLLRVIQERTFRKVGSTKTIKCNATIVASSNRDLLLEANENKFRLDLYYRLAVFPVEMPALGSADRKCDIPLLADFFLQNSQISTGNRPLTLSSQAQAKLMNHNWPGNVRELRNVIERALILEDSELITAQSIMIDTPGGSQQAQPVPVSAEKVIEDLSLEAAEREFILRALNETGWQRTRAANLLGITRATLHSKLKRYGITPPGEESASKNKLQEACA